MSENDSIKTSRCVAPPETQKRCPETGRFIMNGGVGRTPEYKVWICMKSRCFCKNNPSYQEYGGRGITICDRWVDSFRNFHSDMGDRPQGKHPSGKPLYSIERMNNEGDYSPDNCYWATNKEQQNNKRNNVQLTFKGLTLNVAQWARRTGINDFTIRARLDCGWPVDRTLTTKTQKYVKRH